MTKIKISKRTLSKLKRKILQKKFWNLCGQIGPLPTTVLATSLPPKEGLLKEICDMETENDENEDN